MGQGLFWRVKQTLQIIKKDKNHGEQSKDPLSH